jgi:ABC-type multidrug transport system ATPase subunit
LKSNDLLVIAGRIGSGKTTLLNSLMEETIKKSGEMIIKGKIAYVE